MEMFMKHPFCWIALVCAFICYAQRCSENIIWLTVPISIIFVGIASIALIGFFLHIGWLPGGMK